MGQFSLEGVGRSKGDAAGNDLNMTSKDRGHRDGGHGRLSIARPHYPRRSNELLRLGLGAVVVRDSRKEHAASSGKRLSQNPLVILPSLDRGMIPRIKRGNRDVGVKDAPKYLRSGRRFPQERNGASTVRPAQVEVHRRMIGEATLRHHIGRNRDLHLHLAGYPPGLGVRQVISIETREAIGGGSITSGGRVHHFDGGAKRAVDATRGGVRDDGVRDSAIPLRDERDIKVSRDNAYGVEACINTSLDALTSGTNTLSTKPDIVDTDDPKDTLKEKKPSVEDAAWGNLRGVQAGKREGRSADKTATPPSLLVNSDRKGDMKVADEAPRGALKSCSLTSHFLDAKNLRRLRELREEGVLLRR